MKQRKTTKQEIEISQVGDWVLFDELTAAVLSEFGGSWVEQVDGLDQRYWDWQLGEAVVCQNSAERNPK